MGVDCVRVSHTGWTLFYASPPRIFFGSRRAVRCGLVRVGSLAVLGSDVESSFWL